LLDDGPLVIPPEHPLGVGGGPLEQRQAALGLNDVRLVQRDKIEVQPGVVARLAQVAPVAKRVGVVRAKHPSAAARLRSSRSTDSGSSRRISYLRLAAVD
jgi:hypothetical protein